MKILIIAVIVVLVVIVAVVAFIAVARRSLARMQHYQFAHDVLPTQLFADPASVIIPLIAPESANPGGRDFLLELWEAAGQTAGDGILVPPDGLDYSTDVFGHPNSTACLIRLPPPLKKPEAYFAAIVFDGPGLAVGTPRQLRYFVLEHHGEKNGSPKTLVGEWSPKGEGKLTYASHGSDTPPDLAAFVSRVRQIIETSGSQPKPFSDDVG
jgi:hypothetical protein